MNQIQKPDIGLFAYFSEFGEDAARVWCHHQLNRLLMPPLDKEGTSELETESVSKYAALYKLQDSWVVYFSLVSTGSHTEHNHLWQWMLARLLLADWSELPTDPTCWGVSIFLGGIVDERPDVATQKRWFEAINIGQTVGLFEPTNSLFYIHEPLHASYKWGDWWQLVGTRLGAISIPSDTENFNAGLQIYGLLFLAEYEAEMQAQFFAEGAAGVGFMELNLNKAYNQLAQFYETRTEAKENRNKLEEKVKELLQGTNRLHDPSQLANFRTKLDTQRREYIIFHQWMTKVAGLQQTLDLNMTNYHQRFMSLTNSEVIAQANLRPLEQGLVQLRADSRYDKLTGQRITMALQTIQADLDLAILETDQRQQRHEAHRDWLLAIIGTLLGVTQLYGIIQDLMEYWPWCAEGYFFCSGTWRWTLDWLILLGFGLAVWLVYRWWSSVNLEGI